MWFNILQRWSFSADSKLGYWNEMLSVKAKSIDAARKVVESVVSAKYGKEMALRYSFASLRRGQNFYLADMPEYEVRILKHRK